ncbi:MAG: mechanosensitive ion channel [Bacteroidia bacterium]|nr:mechanosensitive ion channel [Bacteroidia bacterium]
MDFLNDISTDQILDYGTKAIGAILVLVIGFWIANRIAKMIGNRMRKNTSDPTAANFITDIMSILLKVLVVLTAASTMGIEMTSFAAIIAAMGLAVGMALQGSLSNFAGGVMMAIFKPFEMGDLIEAQGHTGVVEGLNMFVTTLTTPDSKTVILPNGALSNGDIVNYSKLDQLRVDLVIGIGYDADIQQARNVIMEVMKNDPKVMDSPAPSVNVLELGDSSVNLAVRPFATVANYWDVYFGIQEKVKVALDQAGIDIPYPQTVMHQAGN